MKISDEQKKKLRKLLRRNDPAMKGAFDNIESRIEKIKEDVKDAVLTGTVDDIDESLDGIRDMILKYESSTKKLIENVYPDIKEAINESSRLIDKAKKEINEKIDLIKYDSHFKKINDDISVMKEGFKKTYSDSDNRISETHKKIEKIKQNIEEFGKNFSDHGESYNNEIKRFNDEFEKLWKEIKKLLKHAQEDKGYVVQGTTRMLLYLNGVSMSDIFNQFNFIAGSGISMAFNPNLLTRQMDFTISSTTSLSIIDPTSGTVDGSNHNFVFAQKPYVIISDAGEYRENHGWSWNSGTATVTMIIAPTTDLYGKI